MILVRRKSQVETSKVMKGGINFELKADNIIHAPVDTPKHFINIFKILPDGKKKAYIRKKENSGKLNMKDRNGWSFCSFVCVTMQVFTLGKVRCVLFISLIKVNCTF